MLKSVKVILILQHLVIGRLRLVDHMADKWFMEYAWKPWQRKLFVFLMAVYLRTNKRARGQLLSSYWGNWKRYKEAAKEWAWNYGWKETWPIK